MASFVALKQTLMDLFDVCKVNVPVSFNVYKVNALVSNTVQT